MRYPVENMVPNFNNNFHNSYWFTLVCCCVWLMHNKGHDAVLLALFCIYNIHINMRYPVENIVPNSNITFTIHIGSPWYVVVCG